MSGHFLRPRKIIYLLNSFFGHAILHPGLWVVSQFASWLPVSYICIYIIYYSLMLQLMILHRVNEADELSSRGP